MKKIKQTDFKKKYNIFEFFKNLYVLNFSIIFFYIVDLLKIYSFYFNKSIIKNILIFQVYFLNIFLYKILLNFFLLKNKKYFIKNFKKYFFIFFIIFINLFILYFKENKNFKFLEFYIILINLFFYFLVNFFYKKYLFLNYFLKSLI